MLTVKQVRGVNTACADVCEKHKDNIVEYYCHSHDAIGCHKCKQIVHRNCKKVDLISDVAITFSSSGELRELQTTLKELLTSNAGLKNDINRKTEAVKIQAKRAKSQVKNLRKKMIEMFDDLEMKVNRSIKSIMRKDEANLVETERRVEKLSRDLNDHILKINDSISTSNLSQLFVKAKRAKTSVNGISAEIRNIAMKSNIQRYQFIPEPSIVEMLQNLTAIGHLDFRDSRAKVPKFEKDVNIKFQCDDKECVITGLELLSESLIVAVDHTNESVKVVDITNNNLKSVHKINGLGSLIKPFDLVKTEPMLTAVTYPYRKTIQLLEITDSGSVKLNREIAMTNECFGIDRLDDNIVVSFRKPPSVKILTLTGTVVRTLNGSYTEFPDYVTVHQSGDSVFVSNWASPGPGTVISITPEEDCTGMFEHDKLYGPHGSAVDKQGVLYVCGRFSHNVFQLSENCKGIQEILSKEDGLKGPQSIKFNRENDKLFIGMDNNSIKIFQLY